MKGEVRAPMTVWLLSMFTCGLYGLYFTYLASQELKNYLGKEDVNPVMITAISYFTCMFWGPFQIGKLIMEAQQRAGVPNPADKGVVAWALNTFLCGFGNKMLQEELNKVWEAGGGAPATF